MIQPLLGIINLPNVPGSTNGFTYPYTQPTTEDYGQIRVDQNIGTNDSFFARWTIDQAIQTQTGGFPQFSLVYLSRNQYLTVSETHVFSQTLFNTARFSFSRTNIPEYDPPSAFNGNSQLVFVNQPYSSDFGSLSIGGASTFGNVGAPPATLRQNIFTWSDDVVKTVGRNSLKFGVLFNHFQLPTTRASGERGGATFGSISTFMLGTPSSYTTNYLPGSIPTRHWHYNTLGFYAQDDLRVRSNLTFNLGLRYEFATTVTEVNGYTSALQNITDAGTTDGPPFKNPSLRNFSPRVGFAWDVMGNGKTSVHGGFGLLYDVASVGFSLLQADQTPPFGSLATVTPAPGTLLTLPLVFGAGSNALNGMQYNMQQPHMLQYNLAVDRQLWGNTSITVAYSGSRGIHLMQTTEGNPINPSQFANGQPVWDPFACAGVLSALNTGGCTANPSYVRLNTALGSYSPEFASAGDSLYNSLQVLLTKRMSKGLEVQGSYTWSKSIDDIQGQAGAESNSTPVYPAYPQNLRYSRGPSTFNIGQNLHVNAIYQFPDFHNKEGVLGGTLSGWKMSGIVAAQSGYPFSALLQTNRSLSKMVGGGTVVDSPSFAAGRSLSSITSGVSTSNGVDPCPTAGKALGTPTLWYDPCAFVLPPAGTLGNVGRDILNGPHLINLDYSVVKDTPLRFREGAMLEFRAEFFNILNHPNFITPQFTGTNTAALVYAGTAADVTETPLGTAGVLNNTSNTAREIQFALKILF